MDISILYKLFQSWDKSITAYVLFGVVIVAYIGIATIVPINGFMIHIIILILLELIVGIIWGFSSNRLFLPTSRYKVAIFVNFEEDKAEDELRRLIKESIHELDNKYDFLQIRLYPFNCAHTENDIKTLVKHQLFPIDAVLMFHVRSGYEMVDGNKVYKINVEKCTFAGRFNTTAKLHLFATDVILKNDISIRHQYKDWTYIDTNSYNDRSKIKANLKDFILYYSGIYLLFSAKLDIALTILKDLYKPQKIELSPEKIRKGGVHISKEQAANARLGCILSNLFFIVAQQAYLKEDRNKAYIYLKECEELFPNDISSLDRYTALARFAYECGDLDESKKYTEKLLLFKEGRFYWYINQAFYAIVENNIDNVCQYYEKVSHYANTASLNAPDVIAFLEAQKDNPRFGNLEHILDFAEGFIMALFSDHKNGVSILQTFCINDHNVYKYPKLCDLGRKTINKAILLSNKKRRVSQRKFR